MPALADGASPIRQMHMLLETAFLRAGAIAGVIDRGLAPCIGLSLPGRPAKEVTHPLLGQPTANDAESLRT